MEKTNWSSLIGLKTKFDVVKNYDTISKSNNYDVAEEFIPADNYVDINIGINNFYHMYFIMSQFENNNRITAVVDDGPDMMGRIIPVVEKFNYVDFRELDSSVFNNDVKKKYENGYFDIFLPKNLIYRYINEWLPFDINNEYSNDISIIMMKLKLYNIMSKEI